ncbi:MAG: hypothetical protein K2K44_02135, partial [Oscillospiraceae bacterium]|nr:hypothetical protein [Oscillospiraceae bacterium]
MKHIKLIIACIAVLAFSACGNTADTSAAIDVSNVSDTETASETTEETTTEKITENTESLTETSEEPAEKEENIDIAPRTIDMGDYKV